MAEESFRATYDGAALADSRMEVRELAPALFALGEIFTDAGRLLYPDAGPVALKIEAIGEGSFDIGLILEAGGMWNQVVSMLSTDDATAIANLIAYVMGSGGLFALAIKLKNRGVEKETDGPEPGQVTLTMDDGSSLTIDAAALALYKDVKVRKRAREVVEPLTCDGIDRLDFRADAEVTVSIAKHDVPAYDIPLDDATELLDQEIEMVLEIASATFTEGNKWRFTTGDQSFHAAIEDKRFLELVDQGEPFRKGDALRCRVRIVQTQKVDGGIQSEYRVVEVIEHIKRPTQLRLDGDERPTA